VADEEYDDADADAEDDCIRGDCSYCYYLN